MMRLRILALLLLLATGVSAQEMHRLSGYVQIPGQEISKYFLQITITGTKISGYSITEDNGRRWRATVTGSRDPESEMELEEEKSDNPGYCYFKAKLKLTVVSGRQRWAGPFESHEGDGRPCGKGYMTLLDEAPAPETPPVKAEQPKLKPVAATPKPAPKPMQVKIDPPRPAPVRAASPKPDTPKPRPAVVSQPKPVAVKPEAPKPVIIQAPPAPPLQVTNTARLDSCDKEYRWQSDSLVFEVWDGFTRDGDVISINVDGKRVLDRSRLGLERQRFAVPIRRGTHKLDIEFHEEGTEPPNTPNMILYDAQKRYELNISGNQGERARICIERQ